MKHLRAILLLPFLMTIVIPTAILRFSGPDTFGLWDSVPVRMVLAFFGGFLILLGLWLLIATIRLFVKVGQGLAPWNLTQQLVIQGIYRHVRNPMIFGVMAVLLGEAILTTSLSLFCWFLVFVIANALLHPTVQRTGIDRTVRQGLRGLPAQRAGVDSLMEAVGGRGE